MKTLVKMVSKSTKVTACHHAAMQSSGPRSPKSMTNYLCQMTVIASTATAAMPAQTAVRKMTSKFKTLKENDKLRRNRMRSKMKKKSPT